MAKKSRPQKRDGDDGSEDEAPRKKRGQPTDFKGQRLDFLTEKIPDYLAAAQIKGKESNKSGLPVFWAKLFAEYWDKFPWDLPFDKDPDPNAPPIPPPETAEEAFASLGLNLTPEESERKSQIQKDMKGVRLDCLFFFSFLLTDSCFTENQKMVFAEASGWNGDPGQPVL